MILQVPVNLSKPTSLLGGTTVRLAASVPLSVGFLGFARSCDARSGDNRSHSKLLLVSDK